MCLRGIEVVEVRELVAQRVADAAIRFADFVHALLAHDDVVAEILRSDPEAHHVRAVFLDVGFGSLGLFVSALFALGNLLAIGVHHEAVREHGLERRRAIAREREQQRRLKPAAMLVAAFEIHVGLQGVVVPGSRSE